MVAIVSSWKLPRDHENLHDLARSPWPHGSLAMPIPVSISRWNINSTRADRYDMIFTMQTTIAKLLSCDLKVTSSNFRDSLLQSRVKLRSIESSPGLCIGGSFAYWVALFYYINKWNSLSTWYIILNSCCTKKTNKVNNEQPNF